MKRGITLVELLVVVGIVSILSAITFAVVRTLLASARRSQCIANLHQVGASLKLYQADWDDQNPHDEILPGPPQERLAWKLLMTYGKDTRIFYCPDQLGTDTKKIGYVYRSGPRVSGERVRHPVSLDPSTCVAYCMEHLERTLKTEPFEWEDYTFGSDFKFKGLLQYLTNDGSVHSVNARAAETWVTDGKRWFRIDEAPQGFISSIRILRFPNEPWPPEFQL
jgi:prepilin-type N-terminal cleavage/methylation domain-containing protein